MVGGQVLEENVEDLGNYLEWTRLLVSVVFVTFMLLE